MFHKILIANRGEIALRILRACKEMGIRTVAVHSTADVEATHVKLADESLCIGPPESSGSYLNVASIISAAEITDAEAIHPGYGFLAENPHFAEVCESCRIKFIGPTPEHLRLIGDKAKARKIMQESGVPILMGSESSLQSSEEAIELARQAGYPVLLKAVAGGGGKGMRIVRDEEGLLNALLMVQAEASASFGNDSIFLEKFLEKARHVEVQIVADEFGNVVHCGDRECTIQRRYQKLIEEGPSSAISDKLREEIGRVAVKAVKAMEYRNVGTMEFLLDSEGRYYFIEMNGRIQVEHAVTEMITGIDLIKEQIRIAAGEKLQFTQKQVHIHGHSIECRINAEDPEKFIPCPGRISYLNLPGGPGVRVDTAIFPGYEVTPHYDSLIAKLIVHGENRMEAISRMMRALGEFQIEGVKTTIPFHFQVLSDPEFIRGEISTDFLDRYHLPAAARG